MPSSAQARIQVEHALQSRVPSALSPRARVEFPRVSAGSTEIDALLGGGFPVGALSELVGVPCSGRTSLALALAAEVTRAGGVSAWIDVADTLDPESAGAAGVDLARLLWVRCGGPNADRERTCEPSAQAKPSSLLCVESHQIAAPGGGGSPHPRGESRGMPEAIQAFLRHERWCTSENPGAPAEDPAHLYPAQTAHLRQNAGEARRARKKLGTPGMPNRPLNHVRDREEQPPTDRMPSRRSKWLATHSPIPMLNGAEVPPRHSDPKRASVPAAPRLQLAALQRRVRTPVRNQTWQALDQALRATDLLLNAGGFGALVLDLGSTPPEAAWRVPLATWFRFRAAAERSRTAVLLLTQHPCARSSAELVLRLEPLQAESELTVLTGVRCEAAVARQRFEAVERATAERVIPIRKPPQSERRTQWLRTAAWSRSAS